jgi:hypothetical protein
VRRTYQDIPAGTVIRLLGKTGLGSHFAELQLLVIGKDCRD